MNELQQKILDYLNKNFKGTRRKRDKGTFMNDSIVESLNLDNESTSYNEDSFRYKGMDFWYQDGEWHTQYKQGNEWIEV